MRDAECALGFGVEAGRGSIAERRSSDGALAIDPKCSRHALDQLSRARARLLMLPRSSLAKPHVQRPTTPSRFPDHNAAMQSSRRGASTEHVAAGGGLVSAARRKEAPCTSFGSWLLGGVSHAHNDSQEAALTISG